MQTECHITKDVQAFGPRSLPQQTRRQCFDILQDLGSGSPEAVSKEEEEKGVGKSSVTSGHVEGVPRTKV